MLHMDGLTCPEQGTIKEGMGKDRVQVGFFGKLEPPWLNPFVPTRVNKGHIIRSLGCDEESSSQENEGLSSGNNHWGPLHRDIGEGLVEGSGVSIRAIPDGVGLSFPYDLFLTVSNCDKGILHRLCRIEGGHPDQRRFSSPFEVGREVGHEDSRWNKHGLTPSQEALLPGWRFRAPPRRARVFQGNPDDFEGTRSQGLGNLKIPCASFPGSKPISPEMQKPPFSARPGPLLLFQGEHSEFSPSPVQEIPSSLSTINTFAFT